MQDSTLLTTPQILQSSIRLFFSVSLTLIKHISIIKKKTPANHISVGNSLMMFMMWFFFRMYENMKLKSFDTRYRKQPNRGTVSLAGIKKKNQNCVFWPTVMYNFFFQPLPCEKAIVCLLD